jgi:hypothetical protein
MKTQTFHNTKIQSSKNPLKETKIFQDIIINIVINPKFQHKPKISSFKNSSYKKNRPIIIT